MARHHCLVKSEKQCDNIYQELTLTTCRLIYRSRLRFFVSALWIADKLQERFSWVENEYFVTRLVEYLHSRAAPSVDGGNWWRENVSLSQDKAGNCWECNRQHWEIPKNRCCSTIASNPTQRESFFSLARSLEKSSQHCREFCWRFFFFQLDLLFCCRCSGILQL